MVGAGGGGEAHINWSGQYTGADPAIVKGRGLAPCEAMCSPRGSGRAPSESIHSISCNLVQSGSKVDCYCISAQRRGLPVSAFVDVERAVQHDYTCSNVARYPDLCSKTPGQNSMYRLGT